MPQHPAQFSPGLNPAMFNPFAPSAPPAANNDVDPMANLLAQALVPLLLRQQQNQPQQQQQQPSHSIYQPFALQQPIHQVQPQPYNFPYPVFLQPQQPFVLPSSQQGAPMPHFPQQGQQQGQLQQLQNVQHQPHQLQQAALLGAIQQVISGGQAVLVAQQGETGMPAAVSNPDPLSQLNLMRVPGAPPPPLLPAFMVPLNTYLQGTTQLQQPNGSAANASTFASNFYPRAHGQEDPPADIP
jgi:hypothetical protein